MTPGRAEPGPRVALCGFLGMGNLGNEASAQSLLAWLRQHAPQAQLSCWSADPQQVWRQHGLPGTTLMSYRAASGASGPWTQLRKAWGRLVDIPRTFVMVGRADVVIVPGMGVLEAGLGANPWGLPYWLALIAVTCRVRRRRLVLVSVGASAPTSEPVRTFFRWTARLAAYVSYRDAPSQQAMQSIGGAGHPGTVFADVVFAGPDRDGAARPAPDRPADGSTGSPGRHLVLAVMAYGSAADQAGYVDRVARVLSRLVATGYSATLVIGDVADLPVADRVVATARAGAPDLPWQSVTVSRADTQAGVVDEMARADVAIVSRFHSLVAALATGCPVVSLGYAGKNADLLATFGLSGFDQSIEAVDVDLLLAQVERAVAQREEISGRIRAALVQVRQAAQAGLTDLGAELATASGATIVQRS